MEAAQLPEENNEFLKPLYDAEFQYLSELVYQYCGINLHEGKRELVRSRLCGHLRKIQMGSFREYCDYLKKSADPKEIKTLLNILSTNMTNFFRENAHFDFLLKILPDMIKNKKKQGSNRLRIWSTACSTGEEAYSIAIVLNEALIESQGYIDSKILATDISTVVLDKAIAGRYSKDRIQDIPPHWRAKYFKVEQDLYVADSLLRNLIQFRHLNVVGAWPFKGPFDIIFCRNMMIYFDKATQQNLVERFAESITVDGYLFLGHSESLVGTVSKLKYVQPSVYRKIAK